MSARSALGMLLVGVVAIGCGGPPALAPASPLPTIAVTPSPAISPTGELPGQADCDSLDRVYCRAAVAKAIELGLFAEPDQVVVAWHVRTTRYRDCGSGNPTPKVDVTFVLGNPSATVEVTVGEYPNGVLSVCTY